MAERKGKILYLLHWFPALSETFILREILELQNAGEHIDIARLNLSPDKISHPEVEQFSGEIFDIKSGFGFNLAAHLHFLSSFPEIYFPVLFTILSKILHPKTVTVSLRVFSKAINLAYQLGHSEYDHIHAHFGTAPATGAWILSKLLDVPFSFTLHAVGVFLPDRLLVRKVADSKFTAVISDFNVKYLKERFPDIDDSKFQIVRCGIRPDEFEFTGYQKSMSPPMVLSIGRMVETKGFRYLINAVKLLKDDGKNVELIIIGGGEKVGEYRALAEELGIRKQIQFVGPLPQDQVRIAMREADLFVLASCVSERGDRDGIPVVLMEAMAMGVPTISTEVSGIPELVRNFETGLIVPEKDSRSLADAMLLYLFETDLRKRLPIAGRRLVEETFNVQKNAEILRELIRNQVES